MSTYKITSLLHGTVECFPNFDYSSIYLSLFADLGCSCLTLCSLSIFIPPTVHPVTQCAPDPFHLYFYLCDHVCTYTRVHHIIPRSVLSLWKDSCLYSTSSTLIWQHPSFYFYQNFLSSLCGVPNLYPFLRVICFSLCNSAW